ncbi:vascular endothelial growth factor receptor 3 isoform X2 [Monomorium pharaonis]|uniref:vascular endothelial growth factor receptor 3 isoform X2 n=1 Tax=Monomorium pharaonis TaxID=307658 RepID=UPI001747089F|nr:vascular endothelial growth factor receptor 3 isoform X2 [Monomorium pharaonis]
MFIRWKLIIIYDIIIVTLLYFNTICATGVRNPMKFAGVVENITVYVLEDTNYFQSDSVQKSLKMNVSWMPPSEGKQPSSYSIMITSVSKETDRNETECTEDSALYTTQNKSTFSIIIPQNHLYGIPKLQIRPNCTYKIHVYANPRAPARKLPEVIYNVPECIGRKCNCAYATSILPIPEVEVIQRKKSVIINWKITSNSSHIHSYIISIGIPLMISQAGHSVYNITKISNVTSTINTFNWDMRINDRYTKMKSGYKVLVAAMDHQGCLGNQGGFIVNDTNKTKILDGSTMWLLLVGIIICIILSFICIISIYNKNGYHLVSVRRRRTVSDLSACKLAQWPDLVFQRRNTDVYVDQKSEETHCKPQKDAFEMPYKCINLTCELGKGQFGKVYLGTVNNESTLVAVKMSQCFDACNEPEVRRQLLEEIKIMKMAGPHKHLVNLIGCCTSPNNPICIILEYMEGGDLLEYLHYRRKIQTDDTSLCNFEKIASRYANIFEKNKNNDENVYDVIERQQFIKFALDIVKGMEHLEAKNIIHRDLAARNILLTSNLTLKVAIPNVAVSNVGKLNHVQYFPWSFRTWSNLRVAMSDAPCSITSTLSTEYSVFDTPCHRYRRRR